MVNNFEIFESNMDHPCFGFISTENVSTGSESFGKFKKSSANKSAASFSNKP